MSDHEKCIDFPVTKTDDNPPEKLENSEPKDAKIAHIPRNTFIPEFDRIEIEAPTTDLINYLSVLMLTAEDNLFYYSVHRTSNPEQAEYCFTKALTLLSLANPLARKFLELSE